MDGYHHGGRPAVLMRLVCLFTAGLLVAACSEEAAVDFGSPEETTTLGSDGNLADSAAASSTIDPPRATDECSRRAQAVLDELGDGGAGRRAADQERANCEAERSASQSSSPSADVPTPACMQSDESRIVTEATAGRMFIYLSCAGELGAGEISVHRLERPALGGPDTESRVSAVLDAYAEGPTEDEAASGYQSTLGPGPDIVNSVTFAGDVVTVDFAEILQERSYSPSAIRSQLVAELRANVFQFADVDALELSVEGDCGRFWRLLEEGSCRTLTRQGEDQRAIRGTGTVIGQGGRASTWRSARC